MGKRKGKKQNPVTNNFVAKYAKRHNKAEFHPDRKKAMKKGYRKHKKSPKHGDFLLTVYTVLV